MSPVFFHRKGQVPSPIVHKLPCARDTWELVVTYHYPLHTGEFLTIKKNFQWDGGSIPRLFFLFAHPAEFMASYLVHDAVYAAELLPRKTADQLLRETMYLEGASDLQQILVYWAVRIFGGFCWRRHTPESVAAARRFCRLG